MQEPAGVGEPKNRVAYIDGYGYLKTTSRRDTMGIEPGATAPVRIGREDLSALALGLPDQRARVLLRVVLRDVVEGGESGHEGLSVLGHLPQQGRLAVQGEAVLDGVHAFFDGEARTFQAFGVGGDPLAEAVGLLHDGADLFAGELGGLGGPRAPRCGHRWPSP